MKTYKNLYKELLDKERIREVIYLSAKGKKKRKEVQKVLDNIDKYVDIIYNMLVNKTYYMSSTYTKIITERKKQRELTISPFFPNRILDYLVVESLKPIIRKSMYEYCVGNVDKRGIVYGKNIVAKNYKKYKYYIKLDIRKFYPSTKSDELMKVVRRKISDSDFIALCECVILSCDTMPIGSYYSQWLSNWLLQDLDHLIKEKYKIPFYIRYVDDMLLMGNNRRTLLKTMYAINDWLKLKGLELKRFESVYQVETKPIDFLGFRFKENTILLRTQNFKTLNKKVKKVRKANHVCLAQARSLISIVGWLKQINIGYLYYKNHIKNIVTMGNLRRISSTQS